MAMIIQYKGGISVYDKLLMCEMVLTCGWNHCRFFEDYADSAVTQPVQVLYPLSIGPTNSFIFLMGSIYNGLK